jgi:CubicO group peptidase (beta-lactamase class C family)
MTRTDGIEVHGTCPTWLAPVRDAFASNLRKSELGAAVAVTVEGEVVVDLWGGVADPRTERPWDADTIVNVFSCSKAATALCLHLLVDRELVDLDAPVATYWPEFAAGGKDQLPVRWLLSHRAGLMGPRQQLKPDDLFDWETVTGALAAAEPWFEPGTMAAYHGISFGFLVGEVIRRVSGQSVGTFLHTNVTEPLGISRDVCIGVPTEEQHRCAQVVASAQPLLSEEELADQMGHHFAAMHPSLVSWLRIPTPTDNNTPAWRSAEIPAVNGHMNARGMATMYGTLANGGRWRDVQLVSSQAIERMRARQGSDGDLMLSLMVPGFHWLAGFMPHLSTQLPAAGAFGHGGAGGSYGFADPASRVSFAYVLNKLDMMSTTGSDPRCVKLIDALYASLA